MRSVLITGGLGFLGASYARALLRAGHRVRVYDNGSRGSKSRLDDVLDDVEMMHGDIRDADAVRRAIRGVDLVAHLCFVNGTEFFYEKPAYVLDVGVKGAVNVIDGCIAEGVREVLLASSSEVYQTPPCIPTHEDVPLSVPDPYNPRYSYGGAKIINELMFIHYGREHFDRVVIFRPHNVYGPDMGWEHVIPQFIHRLRALMPQKESGGIPFSIQGTGEETRAFVYIDDFTDGLMLVTEEGEHMNTYHIGTTEEVTIRDVAAAIGDACGVRVRVEPGPAARGGTMRRCPDIAKLCALGYRPRYSLRDGLKPTIAWYMEHDPVRSHA